MTREFEPLNDSAAPYFPDDVHEAPRTAPTLPIPDTSATDAPDPSSKAYAATRFDDGGGGGGGGGGVADASVVAEAVFEYAPTCPAVSRARTRYE